MGQGVIVSASARLRQEPFGSDACHVCLEGVAAMPKSKTEMEMPRTQQYVDELVVTRYAKMAEKEIAWLTAENERLKTTCNCDCQHCTIYCDKMDA